MEALKLTANNETYYLLSINCVCVWGGLLPLYIHYHLVRTLPYEVGTVSLILHRRKLRLRDSRINVSEPGLIFSLRVSRVQKSAAVLFSPCFLFVIYLCLIEWSQSLVFSFLVSQNWTWPGFM